jgi:hypothetical protein
MRPSTKAVLISETFGAMLTAMMIRTNRFSGVYEQMDICLQSKPLELMFIVYGRLKLS